MLGNYALLSLVVSLACFAAMGSTSIIAWRLRADGGRTRWIIAILYLGGALAVLTRGLVTWVVPATQEGIFSTNPIHALAFVSIFAVTIGGSFAFLLMQRERAEGVLRHYAMFDVLTDLVNRRAFMELAEREMARTRRSGTAFALLMLDIDHFKRVNDSFGHQAGDCVLVDFADRAQRCVRTGDVFGRYGGEEFVALLPGSTLNNAIAIAERIRAATESESLGQVAAIVTVSIGVVECTNVDHVSLDAVIALSDKALYEAKRLGRNRVVVAHSSDVAPDRTGGQRAAWVASPAV